MLGEDHGVLFRGCLNLLIYKTMVSRELQFASLFAKMRAQAVCQEAVSFLSPLISCTYSVQYVSLAECSGCISLSSYSTAKSFSHHGKPDINRVIGACLWMDSLWLFSVQEPLLDWPHCSSSYFKSICRFLSRKNIIPRNKYNYALLCLNANYC